MGTRGVIGVRLEGKDKIAYNHFDSYPSGVGKDIVKEIKTLGRENLLDGARCLRAIDEDEKPTPQEIARLAPFTDTTVAGCSTTDWYCLLRDCQGSLLKMMQAGLYVAADKFMADSLFCEWGYIVNLDENTFEVYKGFQKKKHRKGRYASMKRGKGPGANEYYPVALVKAFPLDNIPENWEEIVDPPEEDEG
jgi:hypothetical protein